MHKLLVGLISIVVTVCFVLLAKLDSVHTEVEQTNIKVYELRTSIGIMDKDLQYINRDMTRVSSKLTKHIDASKKFTNKLLNRNTIHSR